jgi:hypothetical protein
MPWRAGWVVWAMLASLPAALPALASEPEPEEAAAAWKRHEVDLVYMGFTTLYSCGGLKSKVKLLLKHVGVRPDVKVVERGCEFGFQKVADFPHLRIVFYAPEIPEPGRRDAGDPVLGVWKSVSIRRNLPRGLEWGDCELVEQFRDRVLSKLTTRGMSGDVNCIPHQLVGNRIDLTFQILTGVPTADPVQAQSR